MLEFIRKYDSIYINLSNNLFTSSEYSVLFQCNRSSYLVIDIEVIANTKFILKFHFLNGLYSACCNDK